MGDGMGDFAFWIAIAASQLVFWPAVSPIFKAVADRIRARGAVPAELEARLAALEARGPVTGETDAMHQRLLELEERVDFAERLLTQQRDVDRLAAGEEV